MRHLVAGGGGFVGSHLVDELLDKGHSVTVLDNFLTGRRANLRHRNRDSRLVIVESDVASPLDDLAVGGPFDRIYHLASPASPVGYGRHPVETMLVNSLGTKHLLDIARRDGARFVLASTSEIYGEPLVHPQVETYRGNVSTTGPRACYDEGKRFAESLSMTYWREYGVDIRIARIFNTYGPRSAPDDGRMIPNFCVQALANKPLTIYGDGSQTRSLCYVEDLVGGLQNLMETGNVTAEAINLGNPDEYTVLRIAQEIKKLTGSESEIIYQPLPVDDPTRRRPDITKAEQLLGWVPHVSLVDGLTRTLDYFQTAHSHAGHMLERVGVDDNFPGGGDPAPLSTTSAASEITQSDSVSR